MYRSFVCTYLQPQNDNGMDEFYLMQALSKVLISVEILKNSNFENWQNWQVGAPALRVTRAGTRLKAHRSLPYGRHSVRDQEWLREKWYNIAWKWSSWQCFARWTWEKCTEFVVEHVMKIHGDNKWWKTMNERIYRSLKFWGDRILNILKF